MPPPWITEAEVAATLTLEAAIDALQRVLLLEADGGASNMLKTHVAWEGGHTLHAIGAVIPSLGFAGTKTWAHTGGGAAPLFILFDSRNGALLAIIEAFTLGQIRTGGMSAVATRWLARADADELAIIGTGKQAMMQVAAVHAVRPLRRVRVFSPSREHRVAFAQRLQIELGVDATIGDSVRQAVAGAAIVTLATRARAAILEASMLATNTHINAVGAITLDRVELAGDVLPRCSQIVADSLPAAQKLSRELIDYFDDRAHDWNVVQPLCRVVAAAQPRPSGADLTLFKAMGMGIADLALAIDVYEKHRA